MEKKIRELTQVLKKPRKAFKSANEEEKQGLKDLRDEKSRHSGKQNRSGKGNEIQPGNETPSSQTLTSSLSNSLRNNDLDVSAVAAFQISRNT